MASKYATEAVRMGLLRFPPLGTPFPTRGGGSANYLVDSRGAIGNVALRALLVARLRIALEIYGRFDVLAGIAKAATPWCILVAWESHHPAATVHGEPRVSGLRRQIEGEISGRCCVLLENFVNTGESLSMANELLTRAGANVIGAVALVALPCARTVLPLVTAFSLQDLFEAAFQLSLITHIQLDQLTNEVFRCK